ncbi:MAG: GNAT family N-acetyltransferase [Chloroflexi bacterium]|nr:GNAT family N-acetyltransferase [Chloroflexota bacterium]
MSDNIDPLMIDIPQQLETERLLMSAPQAGYGPIVNKAVIASFDSLHQWMNWAHEKPTVQESERILRELLVRFLKREVMNFYMFRKSDGEFVGTVGLHPLDWSVPSFEIGYWSSVRHRGQGYTTEAVKGLCTFAIKSLKARRLEIHCDVRNHASAAVAERTGFVYEGTRHWDGRDPQGNLRDTNVYVIYSETF